MNKQYRVWLKAFVEQANAKPQGIHIAFEAGLTPAEAIALFK